MRKEILLNDCDWKFEKPGEAPVTIRLPHTWNNIDGADGGNDYWRGTCTYETQLPRPSYDPKTQQVWLQFDGVNSSADVEVNGQAIAHHDGGYSTFRAEITQLLTDGSNVLRVIVDNSVNDHVYPQKADFTFYGGIYRDVTLLVVSKDHIALNHLGGSGLRVTPTVDENDHSEACVRVETAVEGNGRVRVHLIDAGGAEIASEEGSDVTIHVDHPHLWDGIDDPYLYRVKAELWDNAGENVLDEVTVRCGIRSFHVDPKHGFCLNGRSYPLHGVSRHQDRKGFGNAITNEMHEEDLRLIREVGANTVRLAHYQHAQHFYDLCDEAGLIVWAEIPYISEHLPFGRNNTISQLRELITQNYNHASICMWSISNEITISTKKKKDMLDNHQVLNDLCHQMDPTRLTSLACYAMCGPFNPVAHITDLVGWNLYLGWYVPGKFLNDLWLSFFHLVYPNRPLSYSEYGAEGMPNIHARFPRRGDQSEEYQAIYHEFMLRCFDRHPWMWGTYVWNMFDFAADARDQGGEPGMNHKGLITYDRKIKKDSFYLYKAWWSSDPFVHICSARFTDRTGSRMLLKVYSNQPSVTLYVNGEKIEEQAGSKIFCFRIPLDGTVKVRVTTGDESMNAGTSRTTGDASLNANDKRMAKGAHRKAGSAPTAVEQPAADSGFVSDEAVFRRVTKANPAYKVVKSHKKNNWV